MGKTSKWLKNILTGKKGKEKCAANQSQITSSNGTENPTNPVSTTPKEKRRWSFRRSSASGTAPKELNFADQSSATTSVTVKSANDAEYEQRKHAMAVAAATAAAADAAVAAAQAVAEVIRLTAASNDAGTTRSIEEAAAIKIQSVFRSYLARKALHALRGLVKLQALVRGHLVRKQATATLRSMHALVTAQSRARARRLLIVSADGKTQRQSPHKKTTLDNSRHMYNKMDKGLEENIKIVEMDVCESKGSSRCRNSNFNHPQYEGSEHRFSSFYSSNASNSKEENYKVSPPPSALTELSPRASNDHFEECSFNTAQDSPQSYSAASKPVDAKLPFTFPHPVYVESMSYDYPLFPNYMANTESSRAKVRSHSAPKQRPDSFERQPSRRRASVEGRNVPRPVRMQRSSSHVGATAQNYQYPWAIKLDRSTVSLKDSECGSTSTVLTNTTYCRSLVAYHPNGDR